MSEFKLASQLVEEDVIAMPVPGRANLEALVLDNATLSDDGLWVFVTIDDGLGARLATYKSTDLVLWLYRLVEEPECSCVAAGQPVYSEIGVLHLADCMWFKWFYATSVHQSND
jgi:hypothetical protein